jgi:hypothetical protein
MGSFSAAKSLVEDTIRELRSSSAASSPEVIALIASLTALSIPTVDPSLRASAAQAGISSLLESKVSITTSINTTIAKIQDAERVLQNKDSSQAEIAAAMKLLAELRLQMDKLQAELKRTVDSIYQIDPSKADPSDPQIVNILTPVKRSEAEIDILKSNKPTKEEKSEPEYGDTKEDKYGDKYGYAKPMYGGSRRKRRTHTKTKRVRKGKK